MTSLLVVTGPAGAGKSTVSEVLARRYPRSALVGGDLIHGFVRQGRLHPWLPEARAQNDTVNEATAAATSSFVRGGFDTILDGVLGPWYLPFFAAATGLEFFDYVILLPSVEECVFRIHTRVGHGFKDEAVTRQLHADFATKTDDPRYLLVEPPGGPETVADAILAARSEGRLRYVAKPS